MKTYQHFATVLTQLLGNDTAIRLTVNGYMPLSVEDIGKSTDGHRLVSICHYGAQNGDLMRDPDMVFELRQWPDALAAEPLSFRNDYMGTMQEVYRYDDSGKKTHVNARLKQDLKSLYRSRWQVELDFRNLKTTLGMETLRCRSPQMVEKEIWVYLLAYNLIREAMVSAAKLAAAALAAAGLGLAGGLPLPVGGRSTALMHACYRAPAGTALPNKKAPQGGAFQG